MLHPMVRMAMGDANSVLEKSILNSAASLSCSSSSEKGKMEA